MSKVEIPFLPEFEKAMQTGKKTATTRTKRYGYPGDWFEAFGKAFVLTEVYLVRLGTVARSCYQEEGFNSDLEFIVCWERLHLRKLFCIDQKVYFHKFKRNHDTHFDDQKTEEDSPGILRARYS